MSQSVLGEPEDGVHSNSFKLIELYWQWQKLGLVLGNGDDLGVVGVDIKRDRGVSSTNGRRSIFELLNRPPPSQGPHLWPNEKNPEAQSQA